MTLDELEQSLLQAETSGDWVMSITLYFTAHSLSYGHGTGNAGDEAYWLVRSQQDWDDAAWESAPDPELMRPIIDLATRRVSERKPMAYLLGEAWFAGLRFRVDERVLVPRSPLAELISNEFSPWCTLRSGDRLLDLGTGSGCLAIAAAHYCPDVIVDAVDASPEALEVARANVSDHELTERVKLLESNLFENVDGGYRIILSNPPYVPDGRIAELPLEYGHEPDLAFAGGATGLSLVSKILVESAQYLTADGVLIVEVGEAQEALVAEYPGLPVTWLEFEHGGEGVFVLTRDELTGYLTGELQETSVGKDVSGLRQGI